MAFIDVKGNLVTRVMPASWPEHDYSEELVAFQQGDRWGYLGRDGRVAIRPRFHFPPLRPDQDACAHEGGAAQDFHDGFAFVQLGGRSFYIDHQGRRAFGRDFAEGRDFSGGLAAVRVGKRWGFIDKAGRWILSPRFALVSDFSEGLCAVRENEEFRGKWRYIDRTGKQAVEGAFDCAWPFSEGLAIVVKDERGYVLAKDGTLTALPPRGLAISGDDYGFSEGLCRVEFEDRREEVEASYRHSWSVSQVCFVDRAGKVVIALQPSDASADPPLFGQRAEDFRGGLARVYSQDDGATTGYIDPTGNFVWIDK